MDLIKRIQNDKKRKKELDLGVLTSIEPKNWRATGMKRSVRNVENGKYNKSRRKFVNKRQQLRRRSRLWGNQQFM